MEKFVSFLVAAFAAAALMTGVAAAEAVNCPLASAQRTISNPLPEGWWTTPVRSDLTGTRLQTIAGENTLVCLYGEAGQVQRPAPAGQTCIARPGGFDCRSALRPVPIPIPLPIPGPIPVPSPAAVIQSQGNIALRQTYSVDLEYGAVTSDARADLWFEAATAAEIYLTPRNGARMWAGDLSVRGRAGCGATPLVHYSTDRIALSALPVGSSVCVRTNDSHYSEIRIAALTPTSPRLLSLQYVTWRN